MGELPQRTFNVGCPSIDIALQTELTINNKIMKSYNGTGEPINWEKPYLLLLQHPVTTSFGNGTPQISESLNALKNYPDFQKIILWPNSDAGSDEIAKGIRIFKELKQDKGHQFHYFRNFSPEDYIRVLSNASCCIGNSSSFIRDGDALGIPAVIIGDRQANREHGNNCLFSTYDSKDIQSKINLQIQHGKYPRSDRYGTGNAGEKIATILSEFKLEEEKRMAY
jgi:UDP-N-acetylglucosamine 2-epimerase